MPNIAPELVRRMMCPVTRSGLVECGDWLITSDAATPRKYPIRHGIAILLVEASQMVDKAEQVNAREATRPDAAFGPRTSWETV